MAQQENGVKKNEKNMKRKRK